MNSSLDSESQNRLIRSRWLLGLILLAALAWGVFLRVPLVLCASVHLDSDLAVDGLTLLEAVQGRWRWHYPGTPYMGIGAVFLSWVQARIWGANPLTLVSGGVVAWTLLMLAVVSLGWRVFGRAVAVGSLLPLTFASTGALWLSGRITGGHLLIVGWSAVAWILVYQARECWTRTTAALLGLWCGLGLYLDSMFTLTLLGVIIAGLAGGLRAVLRKQTEGREGEDDPRSPRSEPTSSAALKVLVLSLAFLVGVAPRWIGTWVDAYDSYNEQFAGSLDRGLLVGHLRILFLDCVPRLIAGHRIPGLQADPDRSLLGISIPRQDEGSRSRTDWPALALLVLSLALFAAALLAVGAVAAGQGSHSQQVVAAGMLATAAALLAGFLVSRNIYNQDNYRYLVLLLLPWAIGSGLLLLRLSEATLAQRRPGYALMILVAVLFTGDALAWYRRMGWLDDRCRPVLKRLEDPAESWLQGHPEVGSIYGSYWDVYRLSFLTGGRVKGVPLPVFPNRFPEWLTGLPGGRPETLLVRRTPEGHAFLNRAIADGAEIVFQVPGLLVVHWPWHVPRKTGF
jgi:hypothetical protein